MKLNTGSAGTLLLGVVAVFALSGCEKIDQAATDAVEKARTSAGQVLEDASRARSLDDARQVADDALLEARDQAASLLQQACEFLSATPGQANEKTTGEENSSTR